MTQSSARGIVLGTGGKLLAKQTTLQDKVASGAQALARQKSPTVQQLAAKQGLAAAPVTAYGTGLVGGTPDQAKMAGTPAQKGTAIAQALPTETELSQAKLLRAPAVESAEESEKKEKTALAVKSLGTFGLKVKGMVDSVFSNIVGKGPEQPPAQVQFKLDTAATKLRTLAPTALATVSELITKIATETDPNKKNELTLSLNAALGLNTIDTQLNAAEVPGLISSLPETVATTAQAAVQKTVGDRLNVADLGELGTSYEELGTIIGATADEIRNMSIGELQTKLATTAQQTFAPVQAAQAGLASGLLSPEERAALRQSLIQLSETGQVGAAQQLSSLVEDIDQSAQIQIGNNKYSVDELLNSTEMTDIVKDVLADPEGKLNPFVAQLKKDQPDLYNWIIKSKDGLQQLVTGAQAGVKSFQELQEANRKALEPLTTQKEFFTKLGVNLDQLSAGKVDITKLPPSAQYVLSQPSGAQAATAERLSRLGADSIKDLTPEEIKNLRPEAENGPAAQWLAANERLIDQGRLDTPERILEAYTGTDVDLATLDNDISTSRLAAALGYPGGNAAELDVVSPFGKFDEKDAEVLKQRVTAIPSLKEVANGAKVTSGVNSFQLQPPAPLSTEQQETLNTMKNIFADGFFTQEEADALPWSEEKIQNVIDTLPRQPNGFYVGQGGAIARSLKETLDRRIKKREDEEMMAQYRASEQQSKAAQQESEEALKRKRKRQARRIF